MECPFQVGDEVVCVDARAEKPGQRGLLSEGRVYVVAAHGTPGPHSGLHRIKLDGVSAYGVIPAWRWTRFRKVQKPKTDIHAWLAQKPGDTRKLDRSRKAVPA